MQIRRTPTGRPSILGALIAIVAITDGGLGVRPAVAQAAAAVPRARVVRVVNGEPVVVVAIGPQPAARLSVQIALALHPKEDLDAWQPLALNGEEVAAFCQKQLAKLNKPLHANTTELMETLTCFFEHAPGKLLRVRGRTNALKRPAVYGLDDASGTRLVFYGLDVWKDDANEFRVALGDLDAAPKFQQPGRLRVWLLDAENSLWVETVDWPGSEPAQKAATIPAAPPAEPVAPPTMPEAPAAEKPIAATPPAEPSTADKPAASGSAATEKMPSPEAGPALTPERPKTAPSPPDPQPPSPEPPPPAKPATEAVPPAKEPAAKAEQPPKEPGDMSVEELAQHIEQTWGQNMSKDVRKAWVSGYLYYFKNENPEAVRRDVFLALLRTCYKAQPAGPLREAFATLYVKLKGQK